MEFDGNDAFEKIFYDGQRQLELRLKTEYLVQQLEAAIRLKDQTIALQKERIEELQIRLGGADGTK